MTPEQAAAIARFVGLFVESSAADAREDEMDQLSRTLQARRKAQAMSTDHALKEYEDARSEVQAQYTDRYVGLRRAVAFAALDLFPPGTSAAMPSAWPELAASLVLADPPTAWSVGAQGLMAYGGTLAAAKRLSFSYRARQFSALYQPHEKQPPVLYGDGMQLPIDLRPESERWNRSALACFEPLYDLDEVLYPPPFENASVLLRVGCDAVFWLTSSPVR